MEVKILYFYPENMASKATLWLWELKDIAIIGICLLVSLLAYTQTKITFPLVVSAAYAFLSMRFDNTSILDFIRYAAAFLFFKQQHYEWGLTDEP